MYRCNLTLNTFEVPREVKNPEYGNEQVCPCCGETDFEIVHPCDICSTYVTEDEGALSTQLHTNICNKCRGQALIDLFEFGAADLCVTEMEYIDDLLSNGESFFDLKKMYKEAKCKC